MNQKTMRPGSTSFHRYVTVVMALSCSAALANDIAWDERGGAALRVQVLPGKITEWCGQLHAREDVSWEFEAADPLEMNVHFHEGQAVTYPVPPATAAMRSGRLVATVEQTYCWMWTNRGAAPVALQARLQKATGKR